MHNERTVETVVLLGKRKPDSYVKLSLNMEDCYPSLQDPETEEQKLEKLLNHLKSLDERYYDIVMMRYQDPDISAEGIFEKLDLKSSRGYQVMDACEQECRKFFELRSNKRKKKK